MALDILSEKGTPLDRQVFTWKELAGPPYSKLNDDAFTRIRVILMNGIESDAVRFKHVLNRMNRELRPVLAQIRRVEHFQQTMVNWLNPADQNPLETTIGFEQVAIEVTAMLAQQEPDPYLAQAYRFGLLEDFDHLYRYTALMDRVYGLDANNILQNYTDIAPGRPTAVEHRDPMDDLRNHYDRRTAQPITKINALTLIAGEYQTHDFYMTIGPMFTDPVARQLYAEIAAIEEQHVTHYESLTDPDETMIEKWVLHEAMEVYNYWSCYQTESNPRIKAIWERFLSYELGQLHVAMEYMRRVEKRDPEAILPKTMPDFLPYENQREYVRKVLEQEVDLRASGTQFIHKSQEGADSPSVRYRNGLNAQGSPSEIVSAGYQWMPGTELVRRATEVGAIQGRLS